MNNISSRAEYGLRALVEIARSYEEYSRPITRYHIAARQAIPLPFLTQVLQSLVSAGLVVSSRGRFGGYVPARDPTRITILEVVHALQGPQSPRPCVDHSRADSCEQASECSLLPIWEELKRAGEEVLASYTVADLLTPAVIYSGEGPLPETPNKTTSAHEAPGS